MAAARAARRLTSQNPQYVGIPLKELYRLAEDVLVLPAPSEDQIQKGFC